MSNNLLEINNLYVNADEKEILKGIDLKIKRSLFKERFILNIDQYLKLFE